MLSRSRARLKLYSIASSTCVTAHCHVYSKRAGHSRVYQSIWGLEATASSPWRGRPFGNHANVSPVLGPAFWALRESCWTWGVCAQLRLSPNCAFGTGVPPWTHTVGGRQSSQALVARLSSHPVGSAWPSVLTDPGLRDELVESPQPSGFARCSSQPSVSGKT